jgi:hypothetical protein
VKVKDGTCIKPGCAVINKAISFCPSQPSGPVSGFIETELPAIALLMTATPAFNAVPDSQGWVHLTQSG